MRSAHTSSLLASDVTRKGLGWDRQQDFHEHAQLAHRLECNRFVCSVITATLDTPDVWVAAWEPGWGAIKPYWSLPPYESARPDASLTLSTPFGLVGVAVEWDRATEPMATLVRKIRSYGVTLERSERPLNVCFIVPGERRAQRFYQEGTQDARQLLTARLWVTTTAQLETLGPLGEIWRCIDQDDRPFGMADFETMTGVEVTPQEQALGRRWQVPMPERWAALSPLRAPGRPAGHAGCRLRQRTTSWPANGSSAAPRNAPKPNTRDSTDQPVGRGTRRA